MLTEKKGDKNANFAYLNRQWRLIGSSFICLFHMQMETDWSLSANTGSRMCNLYHFYHWTINCTQIRKHRLLEMEWLRFRPRASNHWQLLHNYTNKIHPIYLRHYEHNLNSDNWHNGIWNQQNAPILHKEIWKCDGISIYQWIWWHLTKFFSLKIIVNKIASLFCFYTQIK